MSHTAKPYIKALIRARFWLLLFAFAGSFLAFAIVKTIPTTYEEHFSYVISLSQREPVQEFRFDGFYALQATDLFATTLAQWVQTPEVIVAAHNEAGISLQEQNPRAISRIVQAQKTAPQLVEVTVQGDTSEDVAALVDGLQIVMEERVDQYHDQGIPAVTFRVVATESWQGQTEIAELVIVVATFVFILFVGVNGVLLAETFRQQT